MASILHLRLILQRFDDLMLWTTLPLERWKCHSLSSFFYPLEKDPGGLFRFEFQRLILICSRQDVHFDKGLPFLSYVFALFLYILFLIFAPLFFLSFFFFFLLSCWLLYWPCMKNTEFKEWGAARLLFEASHELETNEMPFYFLLISSCFTSFFLMLAVL